MKTALSRTIIIACALLVISAATVCALATRPAAADTQLDHLIESLEAKRNEHHIPGMAAIIVKDDEVILLKGFGHADLETHRPVDPDTVFAIGSTTKAMTSAIIGMLVDEGVMSWDDPVRRHLPELAIGDEEVANLVTVRDLLSHRTGLGRTDLLWAGGSADPATILEAISRAELRKPFRDHFQYNNVAYLAAGEVSARAAGMTWQELIRTRLLDPLGMSSASTELDEIDPQQMARGYEWDEDRGQYRLRPMRSVETCAPAGAVNASARDMAQWLRFLLSRGEIDGTRLLSRESLEETWNGHIDVAPDIEYGLGWMVRTWQGRTLIEHAGNIDGFASQVALLPEENLGFAILLNVTHSSLQATSIPLIFSALIETEDDAPSPLPVEQSLEDYVGEYEFSGFERPVKALVRDGRLALDVPAQMVYELRPPDDEGRWRFEVDPNIAVSFDRDDDGVVVGLTLYQAGMELEMPRVGVERRAEVTRAEVQPYLGRYHFEAMNHDVEVLIHNGRLAVDVPDQMIYELHDPDEEGKRRFRVTDSVAVRFNRAESDDGRITSMTLFQGGMEFELPKIADAADEDEVPLDDLLRRVREQYGTKHVASLGPIQLTSEIDMKHQGATGTSRLVIDGTRRYYEETDLGPFGRIRQCANEDAAWSSMFDESPTVLRGRFRDQLAMLNPIVLASDWREQFDEIRYVRREDDDGRTRHVIELRYGENDARMTVFVDDETAFVIRKQLRLKLPGPGAIPVTIRLGDYRRVNGVAISHRHEVDNDFAGLVVSRVIDSATGIEVDDALFDPPGSPNETAWFDPLSAPESE